MANTILYTQHNRTAGFFSNCSVRLFEIINFYNAKNKLPEYVDSARQFMSYKSSMAEDLATYFFEQPKPYGDFSSCTFTKATQYSKYRDLNFKRLSPYVTTFFSPHSRVKLISKILEYRYKIDYDNLCAVFYRGNDKCLETGLGSYDVFFDKSQEILQKHPNVRFLIQTDELEFAEEFLKRFSNSFLFEELEKIKHNPREAVHQSIPKRERKEQAAYLLAAVIILSKAKHLITHSGNCGLWAVLYRGNSENIHQYLKTKNRKTQETIKDFGWVTNE